MTPLRCYESNVTGILRSVAKRPRRLWTFVSTLLRIPPCQGSEHDSQKGDSKKNFKAYETI